MEAAEALLGVLSRTFIAMWQCGLRCQVLCALHWAKRNGLFSVRATMTALSKDRIVTTSPLMSRVLHS